ECDGHAPTAWQTALDPERVALPGHERSCRRGAPGGGGDAADRRSESEGAAPPHTTPLGGCASDSTNDAADGSSARGRAGSCGGARAVASLGRSACLSRATVASPNRSKARLLTRTCPLPHPNETTRHPHMSASSTVRPPVEWTRTSAAESHSGI